jgi:glycosyltransferase involved in cell wall biosynthesis
MKIYIDGSKRHAVSRMFPVWERLGHSIVDNPKHADVQLSVVRITNNSGLPTVLRLDGIYYDSATDYHHRNNAISKSHKHANAVIYQSNTSKLMCERHLKTRRGIFKVIHNGIDATGWDRPVKHEGFNIFCCSKWRRPKRLEETIEVFGELLEIIPDAKLHVIGGFKKGGKHIQHKNVLYYGQIGHELMQELYRVGDAFLHLCKKDSCPSAVVEAIAAGMPVITTNACGGAAEMSELTNGCIVVDGEPESLEADRIYEDKYNKMPKVVKFDIIAAMDWLNTHRPRVKLPEQLTIDYAAKEYISVFEEIT